MPAECSSQQMRVKDCTYYGCWGGIVSFCIIIRVRVEATMCFSVVVEYTSLRCRMVLRSASVLTLSEAVSCSLISYITTRHIASNLPKYGDAFMPTMPCLWRDSRRTCRWRVSSTQVGAVEGVK